MFKVGDKVRVKSSGAVGLVQDVKTDRDICVEFDGCVGTRTSFEDGQLEPVLPSSDPGADLELIQADKGL